MWQPSRPLALAVLTVALTGCGLGRPGGPGPRSGRDVLVTFWQTGGIAGVDKRLTVTGQGDARLEQVRPRRLEADGRLGAEELAALRRRLAAADFPNLPRRSINQQVRDGFQYTLSYQGRTVTAGDGAVPGDLAPVIDQLTDLSDLLARHGR
jgi:hypothetical protein